MNYLFLAVVLTFCNACLSQEIVTDYPKLPSMWRAETIEPGSPGKGIESYKFVEKPTKENPSALWSNYTDCQRLIYVPDNVNARRYLLGCESVNCCWEEQSGNHVEFQIPNVHYSNPNKKVDVYWQTANVTNFGETFEADEWSWSWTVEDKLSQDWRAYTLPCESCQNGIKLIQWQSRAMGLEWWPIEFKGYDGIDESSDEGKDFNSIFYVPEICQKNNLLECPSGLHDKYFKNNKIEDKVYSGRQSECDVARYLRNAGFPDSSIGTMVCISKYESSWNCGATNKNVDGSTDYGLFEINSYYWCSGDPTSKYNECNASCSSLMDCQKNTNCAYKVYKEQGYSAWYGYQYHKSECDNYPKPVCLDDSEYSPVDDLDIEKYAGRWYQVYKDHFDMAFQGEGTCAVADYTLMDGNIGVLNSQINKNGKVSQIKGSAFYEDNNSGGELSVRLDGVPKTSPYWVIELGPIVDNQYEYSIVSDNNRISLFVLTRDVDRFYEKYDKEVQEFLLDMGFTNNINKPIIMSQIDCDYSQFDMTIKEVGSANCGSCGTAYQSCCIGFALDGYPCDCHLQEGGSGEAGSNCGDCGTGFAACCIGYAADGYPCECDVQ
jgi:lipocalin